MKIKIISGGQTGVDQAALRAAKALGIETGGTMPLGWLTEDGPRPEFAELYGMVESHSPHYVVRTEANAASADMTIWHGPTGSRGFHATQRAVHRAEKPFLLLPTMTDDAARTMAERLVWTRPADKSVLVLNIAGSRESRAPGIGAAAEIALSRLFRALLGALGGEDREA